MLPDGAIRNTTWDTMSNIGAVISEQLRECGPGFLKPAGITAMESEPEA
jgi:hypothetical protein